VRREFGAVVGASRQVHDTLSTARRQRRSERDGRHGRLYETFAREPSCVHWRVCTVRDAVNRPTDCPPVVGLLSARRHLGAAPR
jgi:hypothetical protein